MQASSNRPARRRGNTRGSNFTETEPSGVFKELGKSSSFRRAKLLCRGATTDGEEEAGGQPALGCSTRINPQRSSSIRPSSVSPFRNLVIVSRETVDRKLKGSFSHPFRLPSMSRRSNTATILETRFLLFQTTARSFSTQFEETPPLLSTPTGSRLERKGPILNSES